MILANLTKAIREQNWFAVVLEFLIVIAGVVIGFQIQGWNEERQRQVQEVEILNRLLDETEEAIVWLDNSLDRAESNFANLEYAAAAIQSGSLSNVDRARVVSGLGGTAYYPAITPPRAVQDELINSGRSADMRSDGVRTALANYNSQLAFIDRQLEYFRSDPFMIWKEYPEIWRSEYDANENDRVRSDPDLDVMVDHPVIPRRVAQSLRDQMVFVRYRGFARASAFELCQILATELETVCGAEERVVDP